MVPYNLFYIPELASMDLVSYQSQRKFRHPDALMSLVRGTSASCQDGGIIDLQ